MTIVYKVVCYSNGQFYSAMHKFLPKWLSMRYDIGRTSHARQGTYGILVFKTKQDAVDFIGNQFHMFRFKILVCLTNEEPKPIKILPSILSLPYNSRVAITSYKKLLENSSTAPSPIGTYAVWSIKPIRVIKT